MLKGIDISNHQAGFEIPSDIDFCICKATEGLDFVDSYCDGFIQTCIKNNVLFGYYHFAHDVPKAEARYFWNNTLGYNGHGIPIIDYEYGSANAKNYLEVFCSEYHKLSGVWPMVYISALSSIGNVKDLVGSWVPKKCGLWIAGYPRIYKDWINQFCPYDITPWEFYAIWQFTDSLNCNGFEIDADLAYMTREEWMKYATCEKNPGSKDKGESVSNAPAEKQNAVSSAKTCEQIADEVLAGKWGVGRNREQAIKAAFPVGTYEHVQAIINEKMI